MRLTHDAGDLVAKSLGEARRLSAVLRRRARGRGARAKLAAANRLDLIADHAGKVCEQITKRVAGHKITAPRELALDALGLQMAQRFEPPRTGGGRASPVMRPYPDAAVWTVRDDLANSPEAVALLRDYFIELTERYFRRPATEGEIVETLAEFPSTGLAAFFILRADGEPAGCLGLHPTGEITRVYVAPRFRRGGGARALLANAEEYARTHGLTRLFLDTRTDLVEARAFYAACGFAEIPPPTTTSGLFHDHWYEKPLDS